MSFRRIYTNEEADEPEAQGFDFREHAFDGRSGPDKKGGSILCFRWT